MSERLTKRTENGGVQFSNGEYWNTVYPQNENCLTDIHRMAIKLCDLEDKIEQGKILELPCKVGDTLYEVTYEKSRVVTFKVKSFSHIVRLMEDECFGEWVFTNKSEAESKLREMEGERK